MTARRVYVDPPLDERCAYDITLRDGSTAQCGRRKQGDSEFCRQHEKMTAALTATRGSDAKA